MGNFWLTSGGDLIFLLLFFNETVKNSHTIYIISSNASLQYYEGAVSEPASTVPQQTDPSFFETAPPAVRKIVLQPHTNAIENNRMQYYGLVLFSYPNKYLRSLLNACANKTHCY